MNRLLDGDLAGVSLPRDLELVRQAARDGLARGSSLVPLITALATHAPMALTDLALGPKALRHADAVRAFLSNIAALEGVASLSGLYRRLADLAPETAMAVLETAAERHPAASWLVTLAEQMEVPPGQTQLRACRAHPAYAALCFAHAAAAHRHALMTEAAQGRPEPAAALLAAGDESGAIEAANLALHAAPRSPVVPWLAAVGGPDIGPLFTRMVPHLRSREAAEAILIDLAPFQEARALLSAVARGMR